jgi:hypothetical protein
MRMIPVVKAASGAGNNLEHDGHFGHQSVRKGSFMRSGTRTTTVLAAGTIALSTALTLNVGVAEAAACAKYRVVYGPAPVHENPDNDSVVRKHKRVGDYVKGPANRYELDGESGIWFTAVYTSAARDGEGWMRAAQLSYPMSC